MAIGHAAFMRKGYELSRKLWSKDKTHWTMIPRDKIKELIRAMTQIEPEKRFAARDVVETFNVLLEVSVCSYFLLERC